jgi:hypothetical protein
MRPTRRIGTVGTTIRIAIGVLFVGVALAVDYPTGGITWWDVAAVVVGLPLLAVGAAVVVNAAYRRRPELTRRARTPWSASQAAAAVVVIVVVLAVGTALTFLSPVDRIALWLFFGLSMVVAGVRGYDGCEILAIPNTILRRNDAIWCPLYTPVDAAEDPVTQPGGQPSATTDERR